MEIRKLVPWWGRILAKIILSRLPLPYGLWKKIKLFEHGNMNQPVRAFETFCEHAKSAQLLIGNQESLKLRKDGSEFNVLELGPGDSLFTGVIAKSLGASKVWLLDAGSFATFDSSHYQDLIRFLESKSLSVKHINSMSTEEYLKSQNCEYLTNGTKSLSSIPSASIDFCFSNAVLEHVPKEDFHLLCQELKRVLRPGGVSVHRVDLKDHLGGGLNNLRFSSSLWESKIFKNAGFYTNRIRFEKMLEMFKLAGFQVEVIRTLKWDKIPLNKALMSKEFQVHTTEELLISGFDVVLKQ